jgi:predicted SAM-dependent methyltransferase
VIDQKWKDRWYSAWTPVLKMNLFRYRLTAPKLNGDMFANLGCGKSQFDGWVNIDGNFMHHPNMWLDVRYGLPFRDESVKVIYSCHFFEHLYLGELKGLLAECRRVLRPDGGIRVAVPNLQSAIIAYEQRRKDWFSGFPASFKSLGGQFFNEMLCGDQHRLMFDHDFLAEVLTDAGFSTVYEVSRAESHLLPEGHEVLKRELESYDGKTPDPWLIGEALP